MAKKITPQEPQQDGFPGHLTAKQVAALKDLWRRLDDVIQGKVKTEGADVSEDDDKEQEGGKSAFKGVSKDDKEKEKQRKEKEAAMTKKLLSQISAKDFRDMLWTSCQADKPDSLILRFLRARNFDADQAFSMLCASLQWRFAMDVPGIIRVGEEGMGGWKDGLAGKGKDPKEGGKFLKQYEIGKSYAYGTDKRGQPVAYINVKLHHIWDQSAVSLQRYVTHIVESGRMALVAPAEQVLLVFDMTDFGLSNMDYGVILFLMTFFSTYYPEALSNMVVHRAPWVFNTIWSFLKPLIDQAIRDKVIFTKETSELEQFVENSHLPDSLGGTAVVDWHYPGPKGPAKSGPEKEKYLKKMDELNVQFEEATREWVKSEDNPDMDRKREILALKRFIMWRKLDPYMRAPTVFQTQGITSEYGMATWTYKQKDGGEIVEEMGQSTEELQEEIDALESGKSKAAGGSKGQTSKKKGSKKEDAEAAGAGAGAAAAGAKASKSKKKKRNGKKEADEEDEYDAEEDDEEQEVAQGYSKPQNNEEGTHANGNEANGGAQNYYDQGADKGQQAVHNTVDTASLPARVATETGAQIKQVADVLSTGIGRAHQQVEANRT